jgi:hypothetical protein
VPVTCMIMWTILIRTELRPHLLLSHRPRVPIVLPSSPNNTSTASATSTSSDRRAQGAGASWSRDRERTAWAGSCAAPPPNPQNINKKSQSATHSQLLLSHLRHSHHLQSLTTTKTNTFTLEKPSQPRAPHIQHSSHKHHPAILLKILNRNAQARASFVHARARNQKKENPTCCEEDLKRNNSSKRSSSAVSARPKCCPDSHLGCPVTTLCQVCPLSEVRTHVRIVSRCSVRTPIRTAVQHSQAILPILHQPMRHLLPISLGPVM